MRLSLITLFTFLLITNIYGQEYEVSFKKEYKAQNENKVAIEINQLQELTYIILANTEYAAENPRIINQETEYYTRMKNHFSEYSNLPIVKKFNDLLEENMLYYFVLSANIYGYEFNGSHITPTGVYIYPAKGIGNLEITSNPIPEFIPELEEFAKKSNFKKFYKENKNYYNKLKKDYQDYAQIAIQKKWLEDRFDYKINSFRVLTSPLIHTMNATQTFENNDFKETLLFLPTIRNNSDLSKEYNKALNTRVIFTEIDHNYVGVVSENFLEQIDSIFNKREKWLDVKNEGTPYYPTPIKVFDEYLTWGIFILFANDNYNQELTLQVIKNINEVMLLRGFSKAVEFNAKLLELYQSNENMKIVDLYPDILEWSSNQ